MGHEYWIEVSPADAYAAQRAEIARFVRALPTCVLEVSELDFLLRDPKTAGAWDHEVRVTLETARIYVLVSVMGPAFRRDIAALYAWLGARAKVTLVDDAGDALDPRELFATPFERTVRRCVAALEAFAHERLRDPRRDPQDDEVHLELEGLLRLVVDDGRACDGVLGLRASGDREHLELVGRALWLDGVPDTALRVRLELHEGRIRTGVVELAAGGEPDASEDGEGDAWRVIVRLPAGD